MSQVHPIRRITIITEAVLESWLVQRILKFGASGYTVTDCRGAGDHAAVDSPASAERHIRIEVLCQPEVGDQILDYLERRIFPDFGATVCVEDVGVLRPQQF